MEPQKNANPAMMGESHDERPADDDNTVPTLPSLQEMTTKNFTLMEWLTFYRNVWNRHLLARICDMQYDMTAEPTDPTNEQVMTPSGEVRQKLVRERLQERKLKVVAAKDLLAAFDAVAAVLAEGEEKFTQTYLSEEALKVDESVFEEQDAGTQIASPCETPDGKPGTWQKADNGDLVCIPNDEKGPDTPDEPTPEAPSAPAAPESTPAPATPAQPNEAAQQAAPAPTEAPAAPAGK